MYAKTSGPNNAHVCRQTLGAIPFNDRYLTKEQCDQRMEITTKSELAR